MKQSSKRLFSTFVALAFIVVSLVIYFDLIEPAYGNLQTLKGQQLGDQALLVNEQKVITQAKTLLAQYEKDDQAKQNLALAMPSGQNVADALAQIYAIASNNNVGVQSVSIAAPTVTNAIPTVSDSGSLTSAQVVKPLGVLTFQLTATGSYEGLKSFLQQLETNIRIFDITSISIQGGAAPTSGKGGVASNADFFSYSLGVSTYYQVP